jgi:hypothetical protein
MFLFATVGLVSTLAGQTTSGSNDGIGTLASFNQPVGIVYIWSANTLYVTDNANNLIRKIETPNTRTFNINSFKI